jgi:S-adenosylmethionine decarboxylase
MNLPLSITGSHFGEHMMVDGYEGEIALLNDCEIVRFALHTLPMQLGMKCLSEPIVYRAAGNAIKDPGGWTGFVVIEESHISIHTFPDVRFVSVDVYTCRNGMDTQFIESYFRNLFSLRTVEINFLKRGLRFSELAKPSVALSKNSAQEMINANS